jgi:hypothetical protein
MTPKSAAPLQLRISLDEITPVIWRRVLVSRDTTLDELHAMLQILFSWYDYHLYEFRFRDRRFQAPDSESHAEDATQVSLRDLRLKTGNTIEYTYDFGDDWLHHIEVERLSGFSDVDIIPWLVDGERRGPPEDSGGAYRYMELLGALDQPLEDLEDDLREFADWAGLTFDPDDFSVEQARHTLILFSKWGVTQDLS